MAVFRNKVTVRCCKLERSGQITVFMALTMTVIISVILTAVESARVSTIRIMAQTASELAVESALAEYNIPLYERYGIFAIDGNRENFAGDILAYSKKNEADGFFKFEAKQAVFSEGTKLCDMNYRPMEKEILQYMKIRAPQEWIGNPDTSDRSLLGQAQAEKELLENNIAKEEANTQTQQQESGESGEADQEHGADNGTKPAKDPRKSLTHILKDGLLSCVIPKNMTVSDRVLAETLNDTEEEACPEIKDFENADEVTSFLDSIDLSASLPMGFQDLTSSLIVNEYILKHFKQAAIREKTYICDSQTTELQYENEYIICGHQSDRDNLLDALNRIILIRTAFNTVYLFSDSLKQAEAAAAASALTALVPFLQPLAYGMIIAAWAYAEGILDVRAMLEGGRVPLLKNSGNWNLSLTALAAGKLDGKPSDNTGLLYEDYLRILLTLTGREKKYERMENLIQANIRLEEGYDNFDLRQCYYGVTYLFEYAVPSYFTVYTKYKGDYIINDQWSECY